MITVYYAPYYDDFGQFMSFYEPEKVFNDLKKQKNDINKMNNFFDCPAFVESTKNLYLINSPSEINVDLRNAKQMKENEHLILYKEPSINNSFTVTQRNSWIFFSDKQVKLRSLPTYMHQSPLNNTGYYVSGSFDISSWFRPFEFAFQMFPNQYHYSIKEGDPLLYIDFLSDEKIKLEKFWMSDELNRLSTSCVRLKYYRKEKSLMKLYDIFHMSKIKNKILTEIKNNLL
jgi:hypothetical protein